MKGHYKITLTTGQEVFVFCETSQLKDIAWAICRGTRGCSGFSTEPVRSTTASDSAFDSWCKQFQGAQ